MTHPDRPNIVESQLAGVCAVGVDDLEAIIVVGAAAAEFLTLFIALPIEALNGDLLAVRRPTGGLDGGGKWDMLLFRDMVGQDMLGTC